MNHLYETIAKLREPKRRALISCQIPAGDGWLDRTYEVIRARDGQWMVDFGAGPLEPRRSWEDVLNWLCRLSPRDVEMLEE